MSVNVTVPEFTLEDAVTVADNSTAESPYVANAFDAIVVVEVFGATVIETVAAVEFSSPSFVLNVNESGPL